MDTTPKRSNSKWKPLTNKKIALIHSKSYTEILYSVMRSVNNNRDMLLSELCNYFGFVNNDSSSSLLLLSNVRSKTPFFDVS